MRALIGRGWSSYWKGGAHFGNDSSYGRGGAHFGSDSSYWKGVELMLERVVLGL